MNWIPATIRIPEKPLLTIGEVAVAVGIDNKTIKRMVRRGLFPAPISIDPDVGERWSNQAVGVWFAWQDYRPRVEAEPPETPQELAGKKPG